MDLRGCSESRFWRQVGGNGDPARYQADMYRREAAVHDKAGFYKANLGGTAGSTFLSLLS
jgi:hypothetical protein